AHRRRRGSLPGRRVLHPRRRARHPLRRPGPGDPLAARGRGDLGEGLLVASVPARAAARAGEGGGPVIIVDAALRRREEEGRPVRVAMVGAGFMAKGVANQVVNYTPGMRLVGISNRTPKHAEEAYAYAGVTDVALASTAAEGARALEAGRPVVTDDPTLLARADGVDVLLEATGAVECGAHAVVAAIEARKHVVLLNAELDGTVGPVLKAMADEAGVVYTVSDGDQPGVQANLIRFVRGIGLE